MKTTLKSILVILSFYFASAGISQDVYRTQNGSMIISAVSSDTVLTLTTHELLVLLDYQNATFNIKMDKSTFYTGNDSLDNKLKKLKFDIISFTGELDIENINTNGHPPLDFGVEGIISTNDNSLLGTGHLQHLASGGVYSCLLTMTFNLKISDLGITIPGFDLKDEIKIEIIQIVLNQEED